MKELTWVNDLKLRVGYGITGNNNFGNGYTTRTYKSSSEWPYNGGFVTAYGAAQNINPDLKWEEKSEWNIGLDFSFLDNRISGKFDWYHRQVDDMLFKVPAPQPPMIYDTIWDNAGSLTNTGWEFELTGQIFRQRNFGWNSTIRMSHNDSKIKNLGAEGAYLYGTALAASMGYITKLENGSRVGEFWLYKYAGLDENGKWLIYDKDNNVVPANNANKDNANKHKVGNGIPKLIMSWDNNFRYRNFDLGVTLRSWIDYDVFNERAMFHGLKSQTDQNVLKVAFTDNAAINDQRITIDYFMSDATFLSIDNITAGYTLDTSKWNKYLKRVRFYVTARNVAKFTKYKGYNPEVSINGLEPGIEHNSSVYDNYPQVTRWTFGLQLTL